MREAGLWSGPFRRWAAAEAVSLVGTAVSTVVLPILVFERTGSELLTGLVAGVRVLPYLLVGLVAGPVADRRDRRRLLVAGNVAQGGFLALIPLAELFGTVPIPLVFAAALASATCFVFADAAAFGALPSIVGRHRLAAANGALAGIASLAYIAGPGIGGTLASGVGPVGAIWFDVATFALAAAMLVGLRLDDVPSRGAGGGREAAASAGLAAHARRALGFIRGDRVVATLILSGFGNSFAFGGLLALVVPFAVERLASATDGPAVSALFVADAVGALVASLLFARVYAARRVTWLSPLCMAVAAAATLGVAVATDVTVAAALFAVAALASGTTISTGITYRQQAAPPELTSSVNVVGRMVAWGGQPIGAATCGLVAELTSVGTAYVVAAAAVAAAAAGAALALRGHRPKELEASAAPMEATDAPDPVVVRPARGRR